MPKHFKIISEKTNRQVMRSGRGIDQLKELKAQYGGKNWRKCKGEADIELSSGKIRRAELHWYEAHGVGERRLKFKKYLD